MAKNEPARPDVVWTLINDGLEPRPAPWGFVVRNPVVVAVPPSGKLLIKLGVAASVPLIAWARGDQGDYVTISQFIPAGKEITAIVENKSAHVPLVIDNLESLVNVHPLVFKGTAGVG